MRFLECHIPRDTKDGSHSSWGWDQESCNRHRIWFSSVILEMMVVMAAIVNVPGDMNYRLNNVIKAIFKLFLYYHH